MQHKFSIWFTVTMNRGFFCFFLLMSQNIMERTVPKVCFFFIIYKLSKCVRKKMWNGKDGDLKNGIQMKATQSVIAVSNRTLNEPLFFCQSPWLSRLPVISPLHYFPSLSVSLDLFISIYNKIYSMYNNLIMLSVQ